MKKFSLKKIGGEMEEKANYYKMQIVIEGRF